MYTERDFCGNRSGQYKATCILQPGHKEQHFGIDFHGGKCWWQDTEICGAWIAEEDGERTTCGYLFDHDGPHSYQVENSVVVAPPVIEPTDAFCRHGNPAEIPCVSCAAASIEAEVLSKAIQDFKAMSTAFKNLAVVIGQAIRGMNEGMARFENEHGENLRVLLHDAAQRRQAEITQFGTKVAGDQRDG